MPRDRDRPIDPQKIVEKVTQRMYLPKHTEEWVLALKTENVFKIRKLLKKERTTLPPKFRRLYLEDDGKLEILVHFMRTQYPFFTAEEKQRSEKFLKIKDAQMPGRNPFIAQKPVQ